MQQYLNLGRFAGESGDKLGLPVTQILSQRRAQPLVCAGMEEIFVIQEASAALRPQGTSSFVFSNSSPSQGRDGGSAAWPQARVGPAEEVLVPPFLGPHLEG